MYVPYLHGIIVNRMNVKEYNDFLKWVVYYLDLQRLDTIQSSNVKNEMNCEIIY